MGLFRGSPNPLKSEKQQPLTTEFLTKCHLHFIIRFKAVTQCHVESRESKDIFA